MATPIPVLETVWLRLRPFTLDDAATVRALAGAPEVAATTLNIPHPYPEGAAEAWISTHGEAGANGNSVTWAIVRASDAVLMGAISIRLTKAHQRGELDRSLIDWLLATFGGHISDNSHAPSRKNQRACWAWRIMGLQAVPFLEAIQPYVRVKAPQVCLALDFQRHMSVPRAYRHVPAAHLVLRGAIFPCRVTRSAQ